MSINFNTDPYYDDYNELKDFYRILFRPGVAVQARELTQLQTILQKQVSRMGDHLFKNGSQVIPGSVNVDNKVHFAKVNDTYNSVEVTTYLHDFADKFVTGETSGVTAVVVDSSECDCVIDGTIPTLYLKYESTGPDGETKRFIPGENIIAYAADNTTETNYRLTEDQIGDLTVTIQNPVGNTTYTNNPDTDVLGYGYGVEVKEGIYFINGQFVRNDELHLYIGRFDPNPTARVGFKVVESIVTPEEDTTLLDPAQGSYNYTAPGAHRYKISLELTELPEESNGADGIQFIELARIRNGVLQHKISQADYGQIEHEFAKRTYDAEGHFEVNKFRLSRREHLNDGTNQGVYTVAEGGDKDKIAIVIDPGRAYVLGYEVEATNNVFIETDKARTPEHIVNLSDYPVNTSIGNWILIDNVRGGLPNIAGFETVDLLDKYTFAGNSHTGGTSAEKIGTAKVRSIELYSPNYDDVPTGKTQFKLGLFDIKMNLGKSFLNDVKSITRQAAAGVNTGGANIVPSNEAGFRTGIATNDALDSGSGTTTITGQATLFQSEFSEGDVVIIDGQIAGQVASINSQTEMTVTNANSNALDGRVQTFRSVLQETEYSEMMFKLGYDTIRSLRDADGNLNGTLNIRRIITETSDASGIWTHTLTNTSETFLSDQDLANYTLVETSTGALVNIDSGDIAFNTSGPRKTVNISNLSPTTQYTLLTTIRQEDGIAASERSKILVEDYAETFTGRKVVAANTVQLSKADGLRLKDVRVTPGDYDTYDEASSISILENYNFDNGQRPTYYKNAAIILKGTKKVPSGAIKVIYDYFDHGTTGNYFSVDSYTRPETVDGIDIEDIPNAQLENGEIVSLADVVDFRPVLSGTNTVFNEIPKMGTDMTTSFSYYLARFDKITVNSEGVFRVIKGVPSLNPQLPSHPAEEMLLGDLFTPPYTKRIEDVKITQSTNRRYKPKDIGKLETRIKNLETAVILDNLNKEAAELQIIDPETGLNKFKNGFITDDASGHKVGDVRNPDYKVSIDPTSKEIRPMHFTSALDIIENISTQAERESAGYRREGDLISLQYTEVPVISNPYASRSIDVNPYKIGAFKGEITLNPEGDNWKDTDRRPDLIVNDDNGYDAIQYIAEELGITGTQWNEWQTNWTSTQVDGDGSRRIISGDPNRRRQWVTVETGGVTTTTSTNRSRTGLQTSLSSTINSQDYGDRVVDLSYIPYMRARPILVLAKNLKANTKFYSFFDNIPVSSYVKPAQTFKVSLSPSATFMDFDPVNLTNGIVADEYARLDNGKAEPAYQIGDVVKNTTHTSTNISAINNLTSSGSSFNLTVSSTDGLSVGHHVILYNLAANRAITASPSNDNINIPESTITNYAIDTSSELNLRKFKITGISGTTLTLSNIDGSDIDAFSSYSTSAYNSGDGGKLLRLQASGVVVYAGVIDSVDSNNNIETQDIHIVNIKNGFAVGETITGSITTSNGSVNSVTIDSINGSTSTTVAPTMNDVGDDLRTDDNGSVVGTFFLPNTDSLAFRTGERKFKLIDNRTNNDADFDSKGTATYYSTGISLQKERTVVNSRDVRFVEDRLYEEITTRRVTTSPRRTYTYYTGHDPVAQTFTVSSPGGQSVTSVDLFFEEAGSRPVTVELRVTQNGVPSSKIIPFSQVTKMPSELNVSSDGSVATTFKFDAPIYLQNAETYALIVKTDQPGCRFFISEVGQTDIITNNIITSQPLTGSLYLSQNSIEFEINPLYDMKFTLRQAEFSTNPVTVELKAAPPANITLPENPFTMATGTNKVRVLARNHGFKENDIVVISNVADGVYGSDGVNGIPASLLNGQHTVTSTGLDKDSFIIEIDTTDTSGQSLIIGSLSDLINGEYGGSNIIMTRQLDMDLMYLKSGEVIVPDTSITYSFIAENAGGEYTSAINLVPDSNYEFSERKLIKSYENQQVISASPLVKRSSLRFTATLQTTNPFVSPVLDLQKINAYVTSNMINDAQAANINVPELDSVTLLEPGLVTSNDVTVNGTGTITVSTTANSVTGSSTTFTSEVDVGDVLYDASDNLIGTVLQITDDSNIVLEANSAIDASGVNFKIQRLRHVVFENDGSGYGTIRSSVDTADNLLANASIGKWLNISGFSNVISGDYLVSDVVTSDSSDTIANSELDQVVITLGNSFDILKPMYLDLVNNTLNYNGDGTIVASTTSPTITGTNTSFLLEARVGQTIVCEGVDIGIIQSITNDTEIVLTSNAASDIVSPGSSYKFKETGALFEISQLEKFIEDYAPTGAYNAANYISRPLLLEAPADSFKIIFDGSIPVNTDIKVYYRAVAGGDEISEESWVNTNFSNLTVNAEGEFTKREITIEDITPFTKIHAKVVLKSTNPINVPKLKNFQLITYS